MSPATLGSSGAPRVPAIRNIVDIKGPVRAGTLVHFSAEQWKELMSGIELGRAKPKYGAGLEAYPIPGGGVVAQPLCIEGPCEKCRARVVGFGPQGEAVFECQCVRDDRDPTCRDRPTPTPSPLCRLVVRGRPLRLECDSTGCSGTCRVSAVRDGARWVISCACR